jgi:hypothetical protein
MFDVITYGQPFLGINKHQTSNLKLQTSHSKPQTSNLKQQTSNLQLQTSNLKPPPPLTHTILPAAFLLLLCNHTNQT